MEGMDGSEAREGMVGHRGVCPRQRFAMIGIWRGDVALLKK